MKRKKLLIAVVVLVIISLSTIIYGNTKEEIYKEAYDTTVIALESGKQEDINLARKAIAKFPANSESEFLSSIGEFSKQVDKAQHKILVNIIDSINNAEKTLTQSNINSARKSIPEKLPFNWLIDYNVAVDNLQQNLIDDALQAIAKAKATKNKDDIENARVLLEDIRTVEDNNQVKKWVENTYKDFRFEFVIQ